MNYTNLTDDQVRQLAAAIVPLHNVMQEEALLKAFDVMLGLASANTSASLTSMGSAINLWSEGLADKLNADATAQNALIDFPLTMDTDYVGTDL